MLNYRNKNKKISFYILCLLLLLSFLFYGCSVAKKTASVPKTIVDKLSGSESIPPQIAKPVTEAPVQNPGPGQNPGMGPGAQPELLIKKDVQNPSSDTVLNYSDAIRNLANKFASLFPSIEGVVVSLKNDIVIVDLNNKDEIRNGTVLKVFREGKEFRHPLTGEVLGRFEEEVGKIEITEVMENYSEAKVLSRVPEKSVSVGDKVRITASRIKIAVLPFINKTGEEFDTSIVTQEMINSLRNTRRFNIFDNDKFQVSLLESDIDYKDFDSARDLRRIRKIIDSDYLLVNIIRDLKGKQIIDSDIFSLKDNSTIYTAKAIVRELPSRAALARYPVASQQAAISQGRSSLNPSFVLQHQAGTQLTPQKGVWKSRVFSEEIRFISIGDVNGDGLKELVAVFKNKIEIYQSRVGRLEKLYGYSDRRTDGFVALDVADINKNGIDEIYVTNIDGEFLKSFVIEFKGGKFKKVLDNLPLFLRVMRPFGQEPYLVAQSKGIDTLFSSYIYRYTWAGGKLKRGDEMKLPLTVVRSVYGFLLEDIDRDGNQDILQIGNDDLLRLYTLKGKLKWASNEYYGGYTLGFANTAKTAWKYNPDDPVGFENMIYIKGRILMYDMNKDGRGEIIIQRNIPTSFRALKGISGYNDSQMVDLIWDSIGLKEVWRAENVNGAINDFFIGDIDNDGREELVAVVVVTTGEFQLKSHQSMLLVYELYN